MGPRELLDLARQLSAEQRRLLRALADLGPKDRDSLIAFAEFLQERSRARTAPVQETAQPKDVPRPRQESVVAAIKRLSQTYFMLDRSAMLDQTSALMTAHVVQGKPAEQVIDQLEELFAEHYERLKGDVSE
jgi:hypothetical protein